MKLNLMDTAPRDGTPILVWGVWSWYHNGELKAGKHTAKPAICSYYTFDYHGEDEPEGCWFSLTENPYNDEVLNPIGWLPLPYKHEVEFEI
jgi:hypothetical protein